MSDDADTWWRGYMESLRGCIDSVQRPAGGASASIDAQRYVIANLAQAYPLAMHRDPAHPQFLSQISNVYPFAAANPDTAYLFASLGEGGTYRLSGKRKTVHHVDLQFGRDMAGFAERPGPGLASHDLDDFTIGDDGGFSIVFGPRRPAGHTGDFRSLDAAANYLMVRQVSLDWCGEEDALLAIERLDAPPAKPADSEALKRRKLEHLARMVERGVAIFTGMAARLRDDGVVNSLRPGPYARIGGVANQAYFEGMYELREDEALIIQAPLPARARYWGIQLADEMFWTLDYVNRQSSLNEANSRVDSDGVVRAVLCARDPGVENWLDTSGYPRGIVMWRWSQCSDYPEPAVGKVPLRELREHLPADTPEFSARQRAERMRRRRVGAQMRRRW